jgi:hypothetical protein
MIRNAAVSQVRNRFSVITLVVSRYARESAQSMLCFTAFGSELADA